MKVTDPFKKLMAALAAGGIFVSGAAYAANLNENLVINGTFESVDDTVVPLGNYHAPKVNSWIPSVAGNYGFAYSHDGSLSSGFVVPEYANGAPLDLATGGHWYFTPNAGPPPGNFNITAPGQLFQDIDVSAGASNTLIGSGNAFFSVSAFFNSFSTQRDVGHVQVDFRNALNTSVGTFDLTRPVTVADPLTQWEVRGGSQSIPATTKSVRVSIYGVAVSGGPDGYMDNIDFKVTTEPLLQQLSISVNRDTGAITLSNQTGATVAINSYSITSAFESLKPANWKSIADNYDAGSPGANQIDAIHNWSKLTDPNTRGDLSEANLEGGTGGSLTHTKAISIGNNGAWIQNPKEDLVFQYISGNQIKTGVVQYTGHGGAPFIAGDLNVDGIINTADWVILRTNQLTSLSTMSLAEAYRLGDLTGDKLNDHADFIQFKAAYDVANGAGAFAAMLAAVPEPSSTILVLAAGTLFLPAVRRRSNS